MSKQLSQKINPLKRKKEINIDELIKSARNENKSEEKNFVSLMQMLATNPDSIKDKSSFMNYTVMVLDRQKSDEEDSTEDKSKKTKKNQDTASFYSNAMEYFQDIKEDFNNGRFKLSANLDLIKGFDLMFFHFFFQ